VRCPLAIALALSLGVSCVALGATRAAPATISTVAQLGHPRGIAVQPGGGFLVAQPYQNVVRRVAPDGTMTVAAGTGEAGGAGDGGPATAAKLNFVHSVSVLPGGGFVLADTRNDSIRRVGADGVITTIAGVGSAGFSGDGGPATTARLWAPHGVVALADGSLLIADTDNNRVRLVTASGTISTVAGTGAPGYSGDGGLATAAQLDHPFGIAPLAGGGFLVVAGNRVRKVAADGTISTVAGTDNPGYSGDGGPATAAQLSAPHNVAVLPDGGFLIADAGNNRVRLVSASGTISTVAGTGVAGFSGDGGQATAAQLNTPKAVAVLPDGTSFLVGDAVNDRVRLVASGAAPLTVRVPKLVRSRKGQPAVLPLSLSERATVALDVVRRSTVVLRLRVTRARGASRILFGRTLAAATYQLRLSATAAGGRRAKATSRLVVRR
jgi:glucose/arabinose dehydrogenase